MDLNIYPPLPRRKDFRIGVLGAGFVVNECHLVAYKKAGFNPVAIASRDRAKAASTALRHGIPKVCESYDALLDDPGIEVLDIAVPPNVALSLILKACERRTVRGILAQKPLGMNLAEATEAVRACEAAGITLAVNQNMRHDQSVRAAKTLLENGTIGEPVIATIEMRGIPHWQPWQAELGWATLRIMSIHHLDAFRYWFGEPERIYCSTRPDPRTKFAHSDGVCTYILEYANSLRCVAIDDTWTGPAREGCAADLYIKWRIEGLNGLASGSIGWCHEPYTTPSTIQFASKGHHGFQSPVWPESWFPDAFVGTMADLLIALEQGKAPAISGRDNLRTMALVEAAYQSAQRHEAITLGAVPSPARADSSVAVAKPARRWSLPSLFSPSKPAPTTHTTVNNFTPRAQLILADARKEALRFHHDYVGTEHLLLALIRLDRGVAANILMNLGLEPDMVRAEVEKQLDVGPKQKPTFKTPYTPRVKKALALSAKEAKAMNHSEVGTGHLLLGLLLEGEGVAAQALKNLGAQAERTRNALASELSSQGVRIRTGNSGRLDSGVAD
jgi:predicted dehydrogenase